MRKQTKQNKREKNKVKKRIEKYESLLVSIPGKYITPKRMKCVKTHTKGVIFNANQMRKNANNAILFYWQRRWSFLLVFHLIPQSFHLLLVFGYHSFDGQNKNINIHTNKFLSCSVLLLGFVQFSTFSLRIFIHKWIACHIL